MESPFVHVNTRFITIYVHSIFDARFGNKLIDYDDLIDEGIIVDQSNYKKFNDDIVDRLQNFITTHVKSVVISDGDDCENKMSKVELMTIRKSGGYIPLRTAKDFNTANNAYHVAENKRPIIVVDTNQFIVFMDITKLYPIQTEHIDGLDFTKIHLTLQP